MTDIALSRLTPLYEASVAANEGGVVVITDPRPWAYSAEIEFDLPQISEGSEVRVTLGVETGALGIGWLRADGTAWSEHVTAQAGGSREVHLAIPAGTTGGKLVFDNQNGEGTPSRAIIEGIRLVAPRGDHHSLVQAEENDDGHEVALSLITPAHGTIDTDNFGRVSLVTSEAIYSHAAEAHFDLPGIEDAAQAIRVTFEVESGALGFGWVRPDLKGWVSHVTAPELGKTTKVITIPAGTVGGRLVFTNASADGTPTRAIIESIRIIAPEDEDHYRAAVAAEERGDSATAIAHYQAALRNNPSHVYAIAGLGRLRYVDPPQPIMDEMRRWRPPMAVFEVIIEIRNPCNYRCSYCFCKELNNTPVQRFDLDQVERLYSQIQAKMIVTTLDCGGGEPTVHPQFPELLRICSRYSFVSIVTNNSQNPRRWLPLETAKRIQIRSAFHPEAEENIDRYRENARYLIDAGCDFAALFIAHPTRISKIPQYREYFERHDVRFTPVVFGGVYEGRNYPDAYTDEEKELLGANDPGLYWLTRIDSHVYRIRNFRGMPCNAGYSSIQIKADGTLRRCIFDPERVLDGLLARPEICGVDKCGCALRLEKLTQLEPEAESLMTAFGPRLGLDQSAYDWIAPMRQNVDRLIAENGYSGRDDALAIEAIRVYDELIAAYGKDEFPE